MDVMEGEGTNERMYEYKQMDGKVKTIYPSTYV